MDRTFRGTWCGRTAQENWNCFSLHHNPNYLNWVKWSKSYCSLNNVSHFADISRAKRLNTEFAAFSNLATRCPEVFSRFWFNRAQKCPGCRSPQTVCSAASKRWNERDLVATTMAPKHNIKLVISWKQKLRFYTGRFLALTLTLTRFLRFSGERELCSNFG